MSAPRIYTEAEARTMGTCPICGGEKSPGAIVCWGECYRGEGGLKWYAGTFEDWQERRGTRETPGLWYWKTTNQGSAHEQGLIIAESDGANIAVAYRAQDAAIIAAAPSMLAALSEVRDYLAKLDVMQPDKDHGTEGARVRDGIREAIAKAKGTP